ncbi:antibiotic biosynthesis monooxygenase family protein [Flaviaesturariibacter amylovorans]|uniref:Quinol monooxygenase n=1 Tax=Flaviaesturariibacter amylovorans TaxID=1084520 RepID=A0ABP8GP35_9BACT
MILRIVKLSFRPDEVAKFEAYFEERRHRIRHYPGCTHLQLWQDRQDPCVFFTYSHWESDEALDAYRHSEFFGNVWKTIKPMFAQKAEAWSLNNIPAPVAVPAG